MVGQFENSLMPWRTEGSLSTSMPLNLTPRWLRICTTVAEKPHCGNTGVPFMNRTTGLSAICWRMRSWVAVSIAVILVSAVQSSGALVCKASACSSLHAAAQRLIHHLVLLHPALAAEG